MKIKFTEIKSGYEVKNISGQDVVVYNDKPLSNEIILNENSLFFTMFNKKKLPSHRKMQEENQKNM